MTGLHLGTHGLRGSGFRNPMKFRRNYDGKSPSNELKHGVNFEQAQVMWHDHKAITLQAITEPEMRFVRIVGFSNAIWRIVYTIRNDNIRFISVSRAKRSEEKLYGQRRTRRTGSGESSGYQDLRAGRRPRVRTPARGRRGTLSERSWLAAQIASDPPLPSHRRTTYQNGSLKIAAKLLEGQCQKTKDTKTPNKTISRKAGKAQRIKTKADLNRREPRQNGDLCFHFSLVLLCPRTPEHTNFKRS